MKETERERRFEPVVCLKILICGWEEVFPFVLSLGYIWNRCLLEMFSSKEIRKKLLLRFYELVCL